LAGPSFQSQKRARSAPRRQGCSKVRPVEGRACSAARTNQNLSLEPVPPCLQWVMPILTGTGNTLLCPRFGYRKRISTRAKSVNSKTPARLRECDNRLKTVLWQAGSEVGFCRQPAKQAPRESSAHVSCSFRLRARGRELEMNEKSPCTKTFPLIKPAPV
jgi:hypothetical protein